MPAPRLLPVRRRALSLCAVVALASTAVASAAGPVTAAAPSTASTSTSASTSVKAGEAGRYLVTFADEPAASYEGGIAGYARTAPAKGAKLEPARVEVVRYRARLAALHDDALKRVGATKLYDYSVATNGVSVQLTAAQARALSAQRGVVSLERDVRSQPLTSESPAFLGLPSGLWAGAPATAGRGVIVGVLDSGIWPESASFAGSALKRNKAGQPIEADGQRIPWSGACVQGTNFSSQACNDKLIGARYYLKGFGTSNLGAAEYVSPRDADGHGTHTASTAAGNVVKDVAVDGATFGTLSGMAPGARVAAYKVCWTGRPSFGDGCFGSDTVAAIDDAVADGVDVLNYSVGGTTESPVLDAVEQAFRIAANAGVFVAASAGNSGPGASTLDHPSPWLTTVAASTFRGDQKSVVLSGGTTLTGAGTGRDMAADAPLVTSVAAKAGPASAADAAVCAPGTLDPAKTAGRVVQCDRGVVDRAEKSFEVRRAGGVGMVMTNTGPNSLNGDLHYVPTVHLSHVDRPAVLAAAAGGQRARVISSAVRAVTPQVAEFSSRGPSTTTEGDILKPDISAPGVDVLAAVAPPAHHGRSYDMLSGTSMSSPHIAGLAALVKAARPGWSPAAVKSALMTTAKDHAVAADPFAQGAGFVQPNRAVDPGLVFDATPTDWRRYLVGLGVAFSAPNDTLTPIDASDVNQASLAIGSLAGAQTVTRTVTNVAGGTETYAFTEDVPGVTITPDTASFSLGAGQSRTITFSVRYDGAPLDAWATGSGLLRSTAHTVRFPIAVRPVAIAAPVEVSGTGSSGSVPVTVLPGSTGTLTPTVTGLAAATPVSGSVTTAPFAPTPSAATKAFPLTVPAGTALVRVDLDAVADTDDLDLYLYDALGEEVAFSASGAADEQLTLPALPAGTYTAYVNGFATGGGGAFAYTSWAVPPGSVGNASVSPASQPVVAGTPTRLDVAWTGLDTAKRYLGFLSYVPGSDVRTIVSIG